jgi:hypothetical protein
MASEGADKRTAAQLQQSSPDGQTRQQHWNALRLGKFYKLEVSLTQHQHIDDDKVVGIGFELTLGGRAVSSPGF